MFAVLALGLLGSSLQADVMVNGVRVASPAPAVAVATPTVVGGYHVIDQQRGTGMFVVGHHTGHHYDRMSQDIKSPVGAAMNYGSARF